MTPRIGAYFQDHLSGQVCRIVGLHDSGDDRFEIVPIEEPEIASEVPLPGGGRRVRYARQGLPAGVRTWASGAYLEVCQETSAAAW